MSDEPVRQDLDDAGGASAGGPAPATHLGPWEAATPLTRREMLGVLAAIPLATTLDLSPAELERASRRARAAVESGRPHAPEFFTPHEWRTVRVLADLVIPRDARSGSATDAGVPEFIDFTLVDRPHMQVPIRGGLRWLDAESHDRHGAVFADLATDQQMRMLDNIAWPERAHPEMGHGVTFFNRFRDLVASGFWSSRMGIEDLDYRGNRAVPAWNGCPPEALRRLGVSLDDMRNRP